MSTPWHLGPMCGFDLESTGVSTEDDRIVTGCVALINGTTGDTNVRTLLADPGIEIPEAATAVHGITTAHAAEHGEDAAHVVEVLANTLMNRAHEGVPIVGFNLVYDCTLLDRETRRHGLEPFGDRFTAAAGCAIDANVLDKATDRVSEGLPEADRRVRPLRGAHRRRPRRSPGRAGRRPSGVPNRATQPGPGRDAAAGASRPTDEGQGGAGAVLPQVQAGPQRAVRRHPRRVADHPLLPPGGSAVSGFIERTTVAQVGRPMPAPLETLSDGRTLGAIDLGNRERITSLTASWFRDLANAAHAEANAMEAEEPVEAGLREDREPQTEGTQVFAMVDVADEQPVKVARPVTPEAMVQRECNGCGALVGDLNAQEVAAELAGLPLPDVRHECATCRGEAPVRAS